MFRFVLNEYWQPYLTFPWTCLNSKRKYIYTASFTQIILMLSMSLIVFLFSHCQSLSASSHCHLLSTSLPLLLTFCQSLTVPYHLPFNVSCFLKMFFSHVLYMYITTILMTLSFITYTTHPNDLLPCSSCMTVPSVTSNLQPVICSRGLLSEFPP